MKDWIPKVGDLVTPDPLYLEGGASLWDHIGETFMVTRVTKNGFDTDRGTKIQSRHGWRYECFMPAKNQIVINILNDL